jgi:hypothetical protein
MKSRQKSRKGVYNEISDANVDYKKSNNYQLSSGLVGVN